MPPSNMAHKSPSEEKALKEKLLDEKMKLIRQRNEERLQRQQEIEEDIKNANTNDKDIKSKVDSQGSRTMSGVARDESLSKFRGRARGRVLEKMAKETLQAKKFKERQKTNYKLVEKEIKEEKMPAGFLFDDRRVDMSKVGGRSTHSWGGSQFEDVVDRGNSISKERTRRPTKRDQNIEINMTGKERLRYQEWKEERQRVDQARQSRQKKGDTWKREWDWNKGPNMSSSFGGRQYHEDRMRSGQRYGQRIAQQKPDWNIHDDRGDDDFQQDSTSSSNKGIDDDIGSHVASSEDWVDVDQTTFGTNAVQNQASASSFPTNQTEHWDDSGTQTVNVSSTYKKQQEKVCSNSKRNTRPFNAGESNWKVAGSSNIKNVRPTTGNPQKAFGQLNKNTSTIISREEDWEDDIDATATLTTFYQHYTKDVINKRNDHAKCNNNDTLESLTVKVNAYGEREVRGLCNHPQESSNKTTKDNNMDNHTSTSVYIDKQEQLGDVAAAKDDNKQRANSDYLENQGLHDAVGITGQENNMTKDYCCRTDNVATHSQDLADKKDNETKNTAENTPLKGDDNAEGYDDKEVTDDDGTKKTCHESNDEKLDKNSTNTNDKDETLSSNKTETAQYDVTSLKGQQIIQDADSKARCSTPNDNLPKLDWTKRDDTEEPEPDFLKTPLHKNWADYDFDEEEFDLSQDVIFYQA